MTLLPRPLLGLVVGLMLLCCQLCAACGGDGSESSCGPAKAVVSRVIDGDTVVLADGQKVRYLLVDTPENTTKVECFGPEATELNTQLVLNKEVSLTYDQECTDRYGRLLAYVAVDGREINKLLLERGYGCVLYIAPDGEDRRQEYEDIEYEARMLGRGLWGEGVCEENPCSS